MKSHLPGSAVSLMPSNNKSRMSDVRGVLGDPKYRETTQCHKPC